MNMSLLMLIGMFGLHDNIHTVWDNVDYEDPNIIQVTEDELKLMITHNQSIGNDNINQINIYDDNIRDKYQGTCVLIGWTNNNSVYVYHIDSNTFVIV